MDVTPSLGVAINLLQELIEFYEKVLRENKKMLIEDLIEKLIELKREHGSQEVILFTQRGADSWEEYDIKEIYYMDNTWTKDHAILIEGKETTEDN